MLKAIIVDDEQLAITVLKNKLSQFPEVEVVNTYVNPIFDIEELQHLQVNVAFLDVEMGKVTGLDLAEIIHSQYPHIQIVFVTAYAEYAAQAFEVNSLDYLLKPVTTARLRKTINRLTEQYPQHQSLVTQEETGPFVVECFKEFQLYHDGKQVSFKTSKVKELFAFFMLNRNSPVHRDVLIELLWPEQDYKKAKINLHTCISHLRKLLDSFGYNQSVSFCNQSYTFSIDHIKCDAEHFQQLSESIDVVNDENVQLVDDCIALYKGSLFELNDFHWSNQYQQQLENKYTDVLEKAINYYIEIDKNKALPYLQLQLPLFPYDDQKVERYMSFLIDTGHRNEAIKLFIDYKDRLQNDLGVSPSDELVELNNQLKLLSI